MDKHNEPLSKDKIDLLLYMENAQRQEIRQRDARQQEIFKWTNSILIAIMGALLVTKQSEALIWGAYGLTGKLMASLIIIYLTYFSIRWQIRNRKYDSENGAVIQRIDYLLHFYDKDYFDPDAKISILPERWLKEYPRPKEKVTFLSRIKTFNITSATLIFGCLTLLMLWIQ